MLVVSWDPSLGKEWGLQLLYANHEELPQEEPPQILLQLKEKAVRNIIIIIQSP